MSAALFVQWLVLGLVAAWALVSTLRRLAPTATRRLQARLAAALARSHAPAWLRRRAARWEPTSSSGSSCSSGCATCGGCGAASARSAAESPVVFHRRQTRKP